MRIDEMHSLPEAHDISLQDIKKCETSGSHGTLKRKRHEGCEEDREESRKEGPGQEGRKEGHCKEEEITTP